MIAPIHPRPQFVRDPVLVDGVTRAGKFLLGHLVASFEGLEFMQYPPLLEQMLYLRRLGKVSAEAARILVHTDLDLNTYNMMIGRGLNGRRHDSSCIHNAADAPRFLARAEAEDPDALVARFQSEGRLPLYIGHEALANGRTLFEFYPEARLIQLLRDPLALISSWHRRGWGRRFGLDPKSMPIGFTTPEGPVPWFALDWSPGYYALGEMDRVVRSIETLFRMAREELEALPPAARGRIHFVAFEGILVEPRAVVAGLGRYLGRRPLPGMDAVLERERVPRVVPPDQRDRLRSEIRAEMSPALEPTLGWLEGEYERYWRPLARLR